MRMLPSKMVPLLATIAFLCGWAKMIRRRNVWTRLCLKTEKRTLRFQTKTVVCGESFGFQRHRGITDSMDYILVAFKTCCVLTTLLYK